MKIKILFATLLTLALFTAGYAQTLDKAKLDQFFDRLAEKNKAMGSLVIAKDGNVLYTRAIGYSQINGTEKKPLTAASRFRIASITKTFTAVMILQLVEEGKLKLTDTLDKFFPQVPNAQKITILQILSHRSGIPNVRRDQATWKPGAPVTKDEMLALIVKGAPEFEPDTKNSYSNSGYFLLGLILEKLTGKPYDQALEERINSKIGLKDTYIATGRIDVNKGEALTYINTGSDWKQGFETHPSIGFQLISTPGDMAKFIQSLFDLKLISQDSLNQMKTMRDDEGLGMVTFTFAGKTFYGNTGGGDNYGSWLAYQPEEKLVVAYTTNAKVYPVREHCAAAWSTSTTINRSRFPPWNRSPSARKSWTNTSAFIPAPTPPRNGRSRGTAGRSSFSRVVKALPRSKRRRRINFNSSAGGSFSSSTPRKTR